MNWCEKLFVVNLRDFRKKTYRAKSCGCQRSQSIIIKTNQRTSFLIFHLFGHFHSFSLQLIVEMKLSENDELVTYNLLVKLNLTIKFDEQSFLSSEYNLRIGNPNC